MADWLVLHGGALGDLVLSLQLALRIPSIRRQESVSIVSRVNPGDLSCCRPSIRRMSSDALQTHWLYLDCESEPPAALMAAVSGRYVLNALGDRASVVHARLETLAPRAIYSFDQRPDGHSPNHITHQWQTRIESAGLLLKKCEYSLRDALRCVPAELRSRGRKRLEAAAVQRDKSKADRSRAIVIHPGSGGVSKCWPLPCFEDVARQLAAGGVTPHFVLGPAEHERFPDAARRLVVSWIVHDALDPDALVEILAGADAYVGNDSGASHLAALLMTPTVAIFGPTSAQVWSPLGTRVRTVQGDPSAPGWSITPDRVTQIVLDALEG